MLSTWVSTGVLVDPFSEFMVHEVPGMDEDREVNGEVAFWAARHTIRQRVAVAGGGAEPDVPAMLLDVADAVLKAGASPPLAIAAVAGVAAQHEPVQLLVAALLRPAWQRGAKRFGKGEHGRRRE